jgi:hypothetical protein
MRIILVKSQKTICMRTFTIFLSLVAVLVVSTVQAQYCMIPGRTHYSSLQPGITNFKLNTINRTSANVEHPLSSPPITVTTDTTTLMRGQTYTVQITHSVDNVNFPTARNNIRVWIDYNKDFDFVDAGETVVTFDLDTPGTSYSATFTVPMTAPLGYTRLRATAKMSADAGHTLPTSCDIPADPLDYHGEMEDYTVRIADPTSVGEVNEQNAVTVYPNPTTGKLTIEFTQPVSMTLYDMTGKQLTNIADIKTLSPFTFDLNEQALPQGVYFLQIRSGDVVSYEKILKVDQ